MEKPLPSDDALDLIRKHFNDGNIIPTKHFKNQIKKRNISMQDVILVVKNGTIKRKAEKDLITSSWKYRVEGQSIDGEDTAIIISIEDEETSTLVTAF